MKKVVSVSTCLCLCACALAASVAAEPQAGVARPPIAKPAAGRPAPPDKVAVDVQPGARVIEYSERDVPRLKTKLRYTTLIILPKGEEILDVTCGDKEFWVINASQNFVYVKPAKPGSETNLNLITAAGNVYSFVLAEVSDGPGGAPDLKVFIEPKDESMRLGATNAPKFVSSQTLEDYRQQVEVAKEETRQAKAAAEDAIDRGISQFVSNVRFPYHFEAGKKPFGVRAMYNDEKFTYIQARPEETPTLYELKDGKPNLVNFEYRDGVYVVDKILESGYLAIGTQKLSFKRED
jgi:type IV secretory pathway VirB9-like protein